MCHIIILPESDPLDPAPAIRREIDPRDYEFRSPPVIALAVMLALSFIAGFVIVIVFGWMVIDALPGP